MSIETVTFVPLEDWYDELADESLDPLNILIETEENEENNMSTLTLKSTAGAFDVKKWLEQAAVVTNQDVGAKAKVYPCPAWLTLKSGVVSEANAFTVTAGIIKAARQVIDAIAYTQRQHDVAVEVLAMQEQRAVATGKFQDPSTAVNGLNPDGFEYGEALAEATTEVEKLEAVLANGERIMGEIITWINDNAADLNLKVETGSTVRLGVIGNEIRTPRYELLTPETLMYGIAAQREFIRNNR